MLSKEEILNIMSKHLHVFTPLGPEGHIDGEEFFAEELLSRINKENKAVLEEFVEYVDSSACWESWWLNDVMEEFLKTKEKC